MSVEKLISGQFRYLNEQLYKTSSKDSLEQFKSKPADYKNQHTGQEIQKNKWPFRPVDKFISKLKSISKKNKSLEISIADLGCGSAEIQKELANQSNLKIDSQDLKALNEKVIECDCTSLPTIDKQYDICIFSLSLMPVNWIELIVEANRVTKNDGQLQVVEIRKRISFDLFPILIQKIGYKLIKHIVYDNNDMLQQYQFKKIKDFRKDNLNENIKSESQKALIPTLQNYGAEKRKRNIENNN